MALRDPGNAPASGDRIPFIYVRPPPGKTAAKLQGDRIEAPSWIREKGLTPDYEFYLTNQLQNPVSQMFGLILEEMPGSEFIPWSKSPDDPDKLLLWRETQAAAILFDRALKACGIHHKGAFIEKFFGSVGSDSIKESKTTMVTRSRTMNKTPPQSKPVQSTLNSFMLDGFLVKTIEKKERAKRAAIKKASVASEVPKNEIVSQ
jgi:hypothetical protein